MNNKEGKLKRVRRTKVEKEPKKKADADSNNSTASANVVWKPAPLPTVNHWKYPKVENEPNHKSESDTNGSVAPSSEVIWEPAPLPAVNAWFKYKESTNNRIIEEEKIVNSGVANIKNKEQQQPEKNTKYFYRWQARNPHAPPPLSVAQRKMRGPLPDWDTVAEAGAAEKFDYMNLMETQYSQFYSQPLIAVTFLTQFPIGVIPQTSYFAVDPNNLRECVRNQIEYYFSAENLQKDIFLRRKMDTEGFLPINLIAGFPRVRNLTSDIEFIKNSLRGSDKVELNHEESKVRPRFNPQQWPLLRTFPVIQS